MPLGFAVASIVLPSAYSVAGADTIRVFRLEKVPFRLCIGEHRFPYSLSSVFVLPAAAFELFIEGGTGAFRCVDSLEHVAIEVRSADRFLLRAPDSPGVYDVVVHDYSSDQYAVLRVWVLVPYTLLRGEYLNGYRIGRYPDIPYRNLPIYLPPDGFVEVTPENEDYPVSPHFRLKDFICKQNGGYPKYLVLREALLLKLELVLEKVNEAGYPCSTLAVLSGYRTPYYNRVIGNVRYSRHQWGGAADIFIDHHPRDEMMDDLNKDGHINWRDAAILYDLVDNMYGREYYRPFEGGLGRYRKTNEHGPFVHVDVRGYRARWGD